MQRRASAVLVAILFALVVAGAGVSAVVFLRDQLAGSAGLPGSGPGPAGSGPAGSGPAGSGPAGSGPAGSGSAGSDGATGSSHPAYLSPLTGKPTTAGRPVLAVKIDNVRPARPQTGLPDADVVYVEPVEGGLSRIMAIFSSRIPAMVGPVRSARTSDLQVLSQYGHPGLVFSGANSSTLTAIAAAPIADLSAGRRPRAYTRTSSRTAPHNLFADPAALLTGAHDVATARDIGFRFGSLPDLSQLPRAARHSGPASHTVRYGAASTTFTWSTMKHRWRISFDGTPAMSSGGSRLAAATVVIQTVEVTSSGLHDVLGSPTPFTHSIGSGAATVLRDGYTIPARWSRPSAATGTTYTTPSGAPLNFAPGQVWIIYQPR